jgi:hypothetical protein
MLTRPIYKAKYSEYIKRRHSLTCEICENHSPIAAAIIEQFKLYSVNKRYINSIKAKLLKNPYTWHIVFKNMKIYGTDKITDENLYQFADLLYEKPFNYYDIHLLEKDFDPNNIDWYRLSAQPDAIEILEKYPEHIILEGLLLNTNIKAMILTKKLFSYDKIFSEMYHLIKLIGNPNGIEILKDYPKPFYKYSIFPEIARKPNLLHLLFTWDYEEMTKKNWKFKEDLIKYILNPKRILNICDLYNVDFYDLMEMYQSL